MRLVILGAGGYGQTVADVARQLGRFSEVRFLDDGKTGPEILGTCCEFAAFADGDTWMYPAFGNNESRLAWLDRLAAAGIPVPTLVHPTAYVSPRAQLAEGVTVLPKAVVNTDCRVERGVIVNCGVLLDHGCVVEEGVHLSPGAIIKAENRVPKLVKIESGQVIQNRFWPL